MDFDIFLVEQPHTSRCSLMVSRKKQCIPRVHSPRLIGTSAGDNHAMRTIHDEHGFLAVVTRLNRLSGYRQAGLPLHTDSLHLPGAGS